MTGSPGKLDTGAEEGGRASARSPSLLESILAQAAAGAGFYSYAFLPGARLAAALSRAGTPRETIGRYGADRACGALVAALRYGEGMYPVPEWAASSGGGKAALARFARANWYAELGERLKDVARDSSARLGGARPPLSAWHRLVNSELPEKILAAEAGLGSIGKNRILIARGRAPRHEDSPAFSSAVVLGLLLVPAEFAPSDACPGRSGEGGFQADNPFPLCGKCRRCIGACPTGALGTPETPCFDRAACIQNWSYRDAEVPSRVASAWDGRLYGCDSCLSACPYFLTDGNASTDLGRLGPYLPCGAFSLPPEELRKRLKGSVLDRKWISMEALRRNARWAGEAPSSPAGP